MARYAKYGSLPPYEVSEALAPRIADLGLAKNLEELETDGYTILRDAAPMEVTEGIREAILRLSHETEGPRKGYAAALLLGRDPVFEQAVLNPSLLALVEFSCGEGALISQVTGSTRDDANVRCRLLIGSALAAGVLQNLQ